MLNAAPATQLSARTFLLTHRSAKGDDDLSCWLALPDTISDALPPLVAVHGIRREADAQAEFFGERATALGRPVIAPLFERERWPRYQQAVRRGRADLALLRLMTELQDTGLWRTKKFDLFGFSGGAQFAHRFAMLHPAVISRLIISSAGWYTFPDDAAFPYGLAPRPGRSASWAPRLTAQLDQFLALPMHVCVGAQDNTPDRNTRSGPDINAQQGLHRRARAIRWAETVRSAAQARNIRPSIEFVALPSCGHNFRNCITRGGLDTIVVPDRAMLTQVKTCSGNCGQCSMADAAEEGSII
ncbi:alpha/beta fold hydrolase [Anderseniella sp. Alg231-50]|uniref:alpha/beta fold hydrolase n=1 Tax=Anderseniella sp. Alg231-50 TaxID=1922226 RepID=UPI000D5556F3